ncbi:MAG: hypothetical protein ACE5Z5_14185 [Candidatus Bathyarchaeia archaeon]
MEWSNMEPLEVATPICGTLITVFIILANYHQIKIMKRFSGLIGKVMFWYSWGLLFLLLLTIYNIIAFMYPIPADWFYFGTMVFFLPACVCFWKGARVIK